MIGYLVKHIVHSCASDLTRPLLSVYGLLVGICILIECYDKNQGKLIHGAWLLISVCLPISTSSEVHP